MVIVNNFRQSVNYISILSVITRHSDLMAELASGYQPVPPLYIIRFSRQVRA